MFSTAAAASGTTTARHSRKMRRNSGVIGRSPAPRPRGSPAARPGRYTPRNVASSRPSSLNRSSRDSRSPNASVPSSASMNASTSSTERATTAMVMMRRPSWSTDGRTAAIRTPAGNVASKRLNSSVHENTRRSISAFASCAAAATAASRAWSTLPRAAFAFCRRARALASARSAAPPTAACRRESATRRVTLSTVDGEHEDGDDGQRQRDRALVVEGARGEVGSQHHAVRSRSSRPTTGASVSSSAGLAPIRSARVTAGRGSIISTRVPSRASSWRRTSVDVERREVGRRRGAGAAGAGENRAREPSAAQPVLVVHRRLVHDVGEAAVALRTAVPVEHQLPVAQDHDGQVVRRQVHEQRIARRRPAGREHGVHQVERRQIHDARRAGPASWHTVSYSATMSRRASVTTNSRAPSTSGTGHVRQLRLVDRERRALPDLPATRARRGRPARARHLLEAQQRHLGDRVRHDQHRAPRAPAESAAARAVSRRSRRPRSAMFAAFSAGTTAPGGSASTAQARDVAGGCRRRRGAPPPRAWR